MTTRNLAAWVAKLRYEDLSPEAVQKAKDVLFDCIGASLFAAGRTEWGKVMHQFAFAHGGRQPEATILGSGNRTLAVQAALANGTLAEGFELGDVHPDTATRPFPAVVPAALALCEARARSGRDLITAIVAGYEVNTRVGGAVNESQRGGPTLGRGLYLPALVGTFGAAAAAGKSLQLREQNMTWALGIAGALTGGYFQGHDEGAWTRRLNLGMAAERGVTAATLAESGFVGPQQPLEGEYGFYRVFANNEYDVGALTKDLGKSFKITETWLKGYPMNATLHAPCEALLNIIRRENIRHEDIAGISAFWHQYVAILAKKKVEKVVSAQFSLPYALAAAAVHGRVTPEEFTEASIADPVIKSMIDRVEVAYDPELYKSVGRASLPGRVTVTTTDGRSFTETVLYPKGHSRNAMNDDDLRAKFGMLTSGILESGAQQCVFDLTRNLEGVDSLASLMALCVVTPREPRIGATEGVPASA